MPNRILHRSVVNNYLEWTPAGAAAMNRWELLAGSEWMMLFITACIIRAWSPVVGAAGRSCCSVHAWYALVCMCGRLLSITTAQPGACRWARRWELQWWPGVVDSYWVWVTINDSRPLLLSASLLAGLTQWWELYLVAMGLVTVANIGSSNSEDKNSEDTKS